MAESEHRPRKGLTLSQMATHARKKPAYILAQHGANSGEVSARATDSIIREYHKQCKKLPPIVARAVALSLSEALRTIAECIVVKEDKRGE
jgi:hypothetical protein